MPAYGGEKAHTIIQMLKTEKVNYYKVKSGQTLTQIAAYFSVSPYLLAKENDLKEEPTQGQILQIPPYCGNAYVVREGDTKALLCGSEERYERLNGTSLFYVGMHVIVG